MRFPKALAVLMALGGILVAAQPAQKPMKQFLNPDGVTRAVRSYTSVVTTGPCRTIYVSGQGGQAPDGKLPADFTSQATNAFENLKRCLHAAGATFNDVVMVHCYLTDIGNQNEYRRIRAQYFNPTNPPASTIVQLGLGEKGTMIEVEVIAAVPE